MSKEELLALPYDKLLTLAIINVANNLDTEGQGLLMNKIFKFIINDFRGILNKRKLSLNNCGISPAETKILMTIELLEICNRKEIRNIINKRLDDLHKND